MNSITRFRSVALFLVTVLVPGIEGGRLLAKDSLVVNAAPGFTGGASAGRKITLASLKGKPVVLVMAPSPKDRAFRAQMSEFRRLYERMASQGMLFFAAFTSEGGRIPSNIPFILVDDPVSVASSYDISKGFAIAVIGRDGNLDCLSTKPLPGQRVLDLSLNNADVQLQLRR
jgi:hypothetical protein